MGKPHEADAQIELYLADALEEIQVLRDNLLDLRQLVDEQAEDEALWAVYPTGEQPISEAYLQQELRRLHAAVEDRTPV